MNILFLTHRLPYAPDRGDRIRAYHVLQHLSRFARVSLFSLVHDDDELARARSVPFACGVATARVPRLRNLLRGLARLGTTTPLTHVLLDAPDAVRAIEESVRRHPPDVVLAYCSSMVRFAMAPPLADLPFVLDMVDVDSAKWAELATRSRQPRRWIHQREAATLSAFEATAARRARATLVVNERERELMVALAPDASCHIVPNGIDVKAFSRPPEPSIECSPNAPATVVFCGMMNYAPNVEGVRWFARQVWPRVLALRPGARFLVVGADPPASVSDLTRTDPTITVTGRVDRVQPYLWNAAVSVAPLRIARGLQNKVLEALAAGLPAVVTPTVMHGLPEDARSACLEAHDEDGFARCVIQLLDLQPESRRVLAARARLDRLGWSDQLAPLETILDAARRPLGRLLKNAAS